MEGLAYSTLDMDLWAGQKVVEELGSWTLECLATVTGNWDVDAVLFKVGNEVLEKNVLFFAQVADKGRAGNFGERLKV